MNTQYIRVAITLDNLQVAIMSFITSCDRGVAPYGAVQLDQGWTREPTQENLFHEICRAFPSVNTLGEPQPQPVKFRIITEEEVPLREYRNAVRDEGTALVHDMDAARQLHLDLLREERAKKFRDLDTAWMIATAKHDTALADAIEAERQTLRDAPVTLSTALQTATTIDELKAVALPVV